MIKTFFRVTFLSCVLLIGVQLEASAQSTFASKCASFGAIPVDDNPSWQHMNCLLTNAAIEADIPPEVVKGVVTTENGKWQQFLSKGVPNIAPDNGIGLMQVTDRLPNATAQEQKQYEQRLKTDIVFNIEEGLRILNQKYTFNVPKVEGADRQHIENWYFPVMAYNGIVQKNRPVFAATGLPNPNAYQEKVFAAIEKESFLNFELDKQTVLAKFPFKKEHFPNVGTVSIGFTEKSYELDRPSTPSIYSVKKGDRIVLTENTHIRLQPNKPSYGESVMKGDFFNVSGDFTYTSDPKSENQFVWFPLKNDNGTLSGYVSSAYIQKVEATNLDVTPPTLSKVLTITDKTKKITGVTEPFATVYMKVNDGVVTAEANESGQFTFNLAKVLRAGTSVEIYATDTAGNEGKVTSMKVTDVTAPAKAKVNSIFTNSKVIKGTAEASARVTAYVGKTVIGNGKVTSKGAFTLPIKPQKVGAKITIEVKDAAGNKSTTAVTVKLQAPVVNVISTKTVIVSGKGVASTTAQVRNAQNKLLGQATVDSKGNFKVNIKKAQKKGTTLKVTLRTKAGQISSTTIKVK